MSSGTEAIKQKAELIKSHLPTCFNGYSALPNAFSGNSLFGATGGRSKSKTIVLEGNAQIQIKSASKQYQIFYIGEQLAQSDLSFYLKLIPLYGLGRMKLGENIWIKLHEFLLENYGTVNATAYRTLEEKIIRLYSAEVIIIRPDMPPYHCRLISGRSQIFAGKGNKKMIEITLDPVLHEAFKIDGFSFINLTERSNLGNNQVALWLHSYYARHAKPHPVTAKFIYKHSGSSAKDFVRWVRCTLAPAVDKFNAFNDWRLFLDYQDGFEEAKLYCYQKPTSSSQQKYLTKENEKIE